MERIIFKMGTGPSEVRPVFVTGGGTPLTYCICGHAFFFKLWTTTHVLRVATREILTKTFFRRLAPVIFFCLSFLFTSKISRFLFSPLGDLPDNNACPKSSRQTHVLGGSLVWRTLGGVFGVADTFFLTTIIFFWRKKFFIPINNFFLKNNVFFGNFFRKQFFQNFKKIPAHKKFVKFFSKKHYRNFPKTNIFFSQN